MKRASQAGKQGKLDQYIKRRNLSKSYPKPNPSKKTHQPSSIYQINQQEEVKMQVYPSKKNSRVCPAFLLLTPKDMVYYQIIERNLLNLDRTYSQQSCLAFISKNLSYRGFQNIENFIAIKDQEFYNQTLPRLIQLVINHMGRIACNIKLLQPQSNMTVELTRLQILMILASMFFGIMPIQYNNHQTSFGQWMTIRRQNDKSPDSVFIRRQKLKCLLVYFKTMVKSPSTHAQVVRYQRSCCYNPFSLLQGNQRTQLTNVVARSIDQGKGKIQDYYGECCMVDFSNKIIGGGIMKNGCVQEEILFSIFPQTIVAKLIVDQIRDNEAVSIYGAHRFANYSGYQLSFKCQGPYSSKNQDEHHSSVLIAIDAVNFHPNATPRHENQYSKKMIKRQIVKAATGFNSVDRLIRQKMVVCTGAWGCGAFCGDEELKFIIQWIACSIAKRDMMFISFDARKALEFTLLVQQIKLFGLNVADLLTILQQYEKAIFKKGQRKKLSLLNFFKNYVL